MTLRPIKTVMYKHLVKVKGESPDQEQSPVTYTNHYSAFSSISSVLLEYSRYLQICINQSPGILGSVYLNATVNM